MNRLAGIYTSTVGKKVLMALTGIVLVLYVVGHMIGNLQIYMGPDRINAYAEFLHSKPGALWAARLVLLFCVTVHIVAAVPLWLRNRASRPVSAESSGRRRWLRGQDHGVEWADSRSIYRLPHLALHHRAGSPRLRPPESLSQRHPRHSRCGGWRVSTSSPTCCWPFTSTHGVWSLFQSMGWDHPQWGPWRRKLAMSIAVVVGTAIFPFRWRCSPA